MKIDKLNYNTLAFFAGIDVYEAKHHIADVLNITETTPKGMIKISARDTIKVSDYDFTMKSNSSLDGKSRLEYLTNYYSSGGADNNTLLKFSQNKTFIKKIGFTGKYQTLNRILYKPHLKTLQKRWLQASIEAKQYWHKNTLLFIQKNREDGFKWLNDIGVPDEEINKQMEFLEDKKQLKSA